jgi:hypothetical protein
LYFFFFFFFFSPPKYFRTLEADTEDPSFLEERETAVAASKARVLSDLVSSERRFAESVDLLRREVRRAEQVAARPSGLERARSILGGLHASR